MASSLPVKQPRNALTASKKKEICVYKQAHPKATYDIVQTHFEKDWGFKVGLSTTGDVWRAREEWMKFEGHSKTYRIRTPKNQDVEDALWLWFCQARVSGAAISDLILKTKAQEFGRRLGITDLSYSNGWLQKFKDRHNISKKKFEGESASADMQQISLGRTSLRALTSSFAPCDTYNMDETGLFYRLTPNSTLATGAVRGTKKCKDRLTVALCSNADGSHKCKPLVIGKSKRPWCFGSHFDPSVYVTYVNNTKAWMTGVIFQQWLQNFNVTMKMRKRNVLLLVDNAGSHTEPTPLSNVTVRFLPANTTAHLQPMDGGIIQNFKVHYRRYLGLHFVNCIDNKETQKADLRQAIGMIADAWKDVKQATVANCWKHVRILQLSGDHDNCTDQNGEDVSPHCLAILTQ
jgi:hypothetical protein